MPPKTRTLDQIIEELNPAYQPAIQAAQNQINQVDPRFAAKKTGLETKQTEQFDAITQGANRRGLAFSGIPLAEQAEYTSDVFLPALAGLDEQAEKQKFNFQNIIDEAIKEQRLSAMGVFQEEQNRAESARQAELARRSAAAASRSSILNSLGLNDDGSPISQEASTPQGGGFDLNREAQKAKIFANSFVSGTSGGRGGITIIQELQRKAREGDKISELRLEAIKEATARQKGVAQRSRPTGTDLRGEISNTIGTGARKGILNALKLPSQLSRFFN